jgi:hypothetical protein
VLPKKRLHATISGSSYGSLFDGLEDESPDQDRVLVELKENVENQAWQKLEEVSEIKHEINKYNFLYSYLFLFQFFKGT